MRSTAQSPPAAWESIAITGKARAAIRRATRSAVREQYGALGRHILERAFARSGHELDEDQLTATLPRLGQTGVADLLAAVGRGETSAADVIKALYPDYQDERVPSERPASQEGWFDVKGVEGMKFRVPGEENGENGGRSLPIRGLKGGLPVRFAPAGGAVPGDRIVGILTAGEGITIYPIQSPALTAFDDGADRWLDVRWDIDEDNPERFPARISISSINEPGSLATIAKIIGENDGNIDNVQMLRRAPDFHEMTIDMEVWDLKHLNRIINQLRSSTVVSDVSRVNG